MEGKREKGKRGEKGEKREGNEYPIFPQEKNILFFPNSNMPEKYPKMFWGKILLFPQGINIKFFSTRVKNIFTPLIVISCFSPFWD